jgi:16S rRNA (guanine(966)-N(2))-methyltransferase RsmD
MYKIYAKGLFMRVISGTAKGTKLNSIDDLATRPTLDRVKEALFNIIQSHLQNAKVLDLFAGSGALGIECLSRGSKHCVFCDKSYQSINMLKQNIQKTRFENKSTIINSNYEKCLQHIKDDKFDIIFIDPPYKMDIAVKSIKMILDYNILAKDGIIILETDEEKRELDELKNINLEVFDIRKYGRVKLIFLRERG